MFKMSSRKTLLLSYTKYDIPFQNECQFCEFGFICFDFNDWHYLDFKLFFFNQIRMFSDFGDKWEM